MFHNGAASTVFRRLFHSSQTLMKRKGGNSALVVKSRRPWKPVLSNTVGKYDQNNSHPKTDIGRLKVKERRMKERAEKIWGDLENNESLNKAADLAVEQILDNPDQDYIFQPEVKLQDLDHSIIVSQLQDGTMPMTMEAFRALLSILAAKGKASEIEVVLSKMKRLGASMEAEASLNKASKSITPTVVASEVISVSAPEYLHLVSAYSKQGDSASAIRVIGRMKEEGFKAIPLSIYNTVMHACVKDGRSDLAHSMFNRMTRENISVDAASFTILMNAEVDNSNIDGAFKIFHRMRNVGIEPDSVMFTCLIHAYAETGQVEKAICLYDDMQLSGVTPTHVTYNALIHACAMSSAWHHRASLYFELMKTNGFYPDEQSYNTLLHAHSRQGDVLAAQAVLAEMDRHEVPWNEITYNTMFNILARASNKHIADRAPTVMKHLDAQKELDLRKERVLTHERELEEGTGTPELNFHEDGSIMSYADTEKAAKEDYSWMTGDEEYHQAEMEEIRKTLAEEEGGEEETSLEKQSDDENQLYLEQLAGGRGGNKDDLMAVNNEKHRLSLPFPEQQKLNIADAEKLFNRITESDGVEPSLVTLNSMLNVYASALRLQTAMTFFENEYSKRNLSPDQHTYRTLVRMFLRAKRVDRAVKVLGLMKEADITPDGYLFGILIDYFANKRHMDHTLRLLQEARKQGVEVEEKFMKRARRLADQKRIISDLIPEDPMAHMYMPRHQYLRRASENRRAVENTTRMFPNKKNRSPKMVTHNNS